MRKTSKLMLGLDLCALVEFLRADPSLIKLMSEHVGTVHVASVSAEAAAKLDEAGAAAIGLQVVEPSLSQASDAASSRGAMSFHQRLAAILAAHHGWTCVSNCEHLTFDCGTRKVRVLRSFEVLERLVGVGALAAKRAETAARALHSMNGRHLTSAHLAVFARRLRRKSAS